MIVRSFLQTLAVVSLLGACEPVRRPDLASSARCPGSFEVADLPADDPARERYEEWRSALEVEPWHLEITWSGGGSLELLQTLEVAVGPTADGALYKGDVMDDEGACRPALLGVDGLDLPVLFPGLDDFKACSLWSNVGQDGVDWRALCEVNPVRGSPEELLPWFVDLLGVEARRAGEVPRLVFVFNGQDGAGEVTAHTLPDGTAYPALEIGAGTFTVPGARE